jgi:hypothetical protein
MKHASSFVRLSIATFCALLFFTIPSVSRNGMWIPSLLKQLNEGDLKKMGLEIPVEELFDKDKGGLNEAIVQFGNGCTGEIVSEKGLLLTNHHCGFGQIQALSTLENNYLEKGYWSMSEDQELPCPGLTVTFIRAIDDVTEIVLQRIPAGASEEQRNAAVKSAGDSLEKSASVNGRKAIVRSFFGGNQFYLFRRGDGQLGLAASHRRLLGLPNLCRQRQPPG